MERACSRRRSSRVDDLSRSLLLAVVALVALLALSRDALADVTLTPSGDGRFGAWLALGPIAANAKGTRTPRTMDAGVLGGADDAALTARFGRAVSITAPEGDADAPTTASWRIISSGGGPIDVAASLSPRPGEAFAFLYGILHLTERLKGAIMVGSSDGARLYVDKRVL